MDGRQRAANGTFLKGQPSPEGARRKKGSLNKLSSDVKAGCIAGLAKHGADGRGKDGFEGYIFFLAKKHPRAAAKIVEKLLPLQVNGSGLGTTIGSINIVSVPSDNFLTAADMARLRQPGLDLIEAAEHSDLESQETPADPDDTSGTQ